LTNARGAYRNRTGVNGFAGRCVTTPPRRRGSSVAAGLEEAVAAALPLVALDGVGVADAGLVGVEAVLLVRAALAKQVPALVEPDSELLEAIMLRG
jgi:hypothetical protein